MSRPVQEATGLSLTILRTHPPTLHIAADGIVPSSGWTNARLEPRIYITFPADGVQEFDFVADPPTGHALWVMSPIHVIADIQGYPSEWKGIRIHTATNKLEQPISEAITLRS